MSIIPKTTCTRCHRQYPATRSCCPYCQTKKPREQRRSVPEADSAVRGTQANERAAENLNWQMIFGTIIVAAVMAAVIAIVSLGVTDDISASASLSDSQVLTSENGQQAASAPDAASTAVPTATPEPTIIPSPEPLVTSVGITYLGYDQPGFTQYVGDKVQLDVAFYPINNELTPEWTSSNESVATVDQTGLVTLVGAGTCVISVTVGDKTDTCDVISRE